ncbi:hypothetical protein M514_08297 [Trichuris suis]|uniref:Uncharacterized protein n=1 Tax=Trichuris suis TaxID=68888 RepID=A0A085M0W3_9BILA|nr:hypothetical protein M513_08297 [Trichuris suis]KFD68939.1 hypothetical protein M514_08297 [Trichuris suis]
MYLRTIEGWQVANSKSNGHLENAYRANESAAWLVALSAVVFCVFMVRKSASDEISKTALHRTSASLKGSTQSDLTSRRSTKERKKSLENRPTNKSCLCKLLNILFCNCICCRCCRCCCCRKRKKSRGSLSPQDPLSPQLSKSPENKSDEKNRRNDALKKGDVPSPSRELRSPPERKRSCLCRFIRWLCCCKEKDLQRSPSPENVEANVPTKKQKGKRCCLCRMVCLLCSYIWCCLCCRRKKKTETKQQKKSPESKPSLFESTYEVTPGYETALTKKAWEEEGDGGAASVEISKIDNVSTSTAVEIGTSTVSRSPEGVSIRSVMS